jgi:hypothetical protein
MLRGLVDQGDVDPFQVFAWRVVNHCGRVAKTWPGYRSIFAKGFVTLPCREREVSVAS